MDPDAALHALAARQHWVVSMSQLRALGFTARQVQRRGASGRLHRVHRGVFALGRPTLTERGHLLAAVLACGDGAVVSHRSAAALHGFRPHRGAVEVTVPRTGARSRRGIRVHVSRALGPDVTTTRHGVPVTTIDRTITDLADVLPRAAHAHALAGAERAGLVDRRDLRRHAGRRRADHGEHVWTRSGFERRFRRALEAWDLPQPEFNQDVDGWEVDCLWRPQLLVAELDHPATHLNPEAFERDRLKQERLDELGLRVRRITERRFRERPLEVRATLVRALGP